MYRRLMGVDQHRHTQSLPLELTVPRESLRHNTPKRKTRSAQLLAGSTPDSPRNTHSGPVS